ncbi:MAG: FG-GAP-like repeat-containing protein [Pyrinomonadaceae bacterium]
MIHHNSNAAKRVVRLSALLVLVFFVSGVEAGSLDGSFGIGGKVATDNLFYDSSQGVFVLPDGKILVAGQSAQVGFHMYFPSPMAIRYNSDGTLDTTFGTNGKVRAGGLMTVFGVLLQPDGKIIFAGGSDPTWNTSPNDFALVRYNADGSLDQNFGTDGKVITNINSTYGGKEYIGKIFLLPGGKILAIGGSINSPGPGPTNPDAPAIELARYNTDGSLDTSFGTGGVKSIPYGFPSQLASQQIQGAALLPDGKFLVLGFEPGFVGGYLIRFNSDGTFDGTFGVNGVTENNGSYLALQPDGKYLTTLSQNGNNTAFELVRFNADGSSDNTFGTNGTVLTTFPQYRAYVSDVVLKANGEIYVVGRVADYEGDNSNFAIARYQANGGLLAKTTTTFAYSSSASTLAFQPDGKIVVAGTVQPFQTDVAVARYLEITSNTGRFRRSYDFNADGRDDISVYRPGGSGTSIWYPAPNLNGYLFGLQGDIIAPGDYTGDGVPDLAVYRPSTGYWYHTKSLVNTTTEFTSIRWGSAGDIPVAADYDDDGKCDVAVFRPSQGAWYIRNSADNSLRSVQWGTAGDIPVAGDYDGDGRVDIAVYRPSAGAWYILRSSNGQMLSYGFGAIGDRPVAADYDGDGTTDISVFRPSDGVWYSIRSFDGSFVAQPWGTSGDVPSPGDFDGDGKADLAVFRHDATFGYWYVLRSSNNSMQYLQWGSPNDLPVPGN